MPEPKVDSNSVKLGILVTKKELADAMRISMSCLDSLISRGRIAPPNIRYSKRTIYYSRLAAISILAGGDGVVTKVTKSKNEI